MPPPGAGRPGEKISQPNTKVIPIKDGYAISATRSLPLTPWPGDRRWRRARATSLRVRAIMRHMDTKVSRGSKVISRAVEGALLAVGDLHACMRATRELSGTGIETAGRSSEDHGHQEQALKRPMVETKDSIKPSRR